MNWSKNQIRDHLSLVPLIKKILDISFFHVVVIKNVWNIMGSVLIMFSPIKRNKIRVILKLIVTLIISFSIVMLIVLAVVIIWIAALTIIRKVFLWFVQKRWCKKIGKRQTTQDKYSKYQISGVQDKIISSKSGGIQQSSLFSLLLA